MNRSRTMILFSLRRFPQEFLRLLAVLLGCVLAGWLALCAVYALPTAPMQEHLLSALPTLEVEGDRYIPTTGSRLDNYTDAIELGTAVFPGENGLWAESLSATHYEVDGCDGPLVSLLAYSRGEAEEENLHRADYNYYWHGYLVFLKPFLLLFNFSLFRELGPLVVLLVICAVCLLLQREGLSPLIPGYLCAMVALNPTAVAVSLQFSPLFYVSHFGLFAALLWHQKLEERGRWPLLFLIVGALTSYVDLLTAPLMTLGLVLVAVLALSGCDFFARLWHIVCLGFSWVMGYLGMWAGKWLLASIVLRQNVFAKAFSEILYRTSTANELAGEAPNTLLGTLQANLGELVSYSIDLVLLAFLCYGLLRFVRNRHAFAANAPARILSCLPFAVMAVSPFLWYAVTINHSATHYWFTYRALSVFLFAGYTILMLLGAPAEKAAAPQTFKPDPHTN